MVDEETRAWLALGLCSDGRPDAWLALARACGGALAAVRADDDTLFVHGASPQAAALLRRMWSEASPRIAERCARLGLGIAAFGSEAYPAALRSIVDPPLVLFWRGCRPSEVSPALAVVGARRCSDYGERTATRIAREAAAAGIVVVSGLARGIDAAAHRGALETGLTAAVLAGGLDRVYPGEHRCLAEAVTAAGGCVMSEQAPGSRPIPWLFPFRNRIITGLGHATIVVEAGARSGSLASARHALDQGRDVFAVPGPIDSEVSEGSNSLLSQGAAPFCRIADLRAVKGFSNILKKKTDKSLKLKEYDLSGLGGEEVAVLTAIRAGMATSDEIAASTALDGTRVLTLLTALELDGLIRREAHGRFRAVAAPR